MPRPVRQFFGSFGVGIVLCASLLAGSPPTVSAKAIHHNRHNGEVAQDTGVSYRDLPWRTVPAHSVLLKELRSGRVLYEHESEKRMSPASLTKIMSALVILERGHL
ncbi:MAG: hypothetical protein HP477_00795, partial [Nitrospira sp.]|nr:hypothetical protein [Nitrospira sp.]